MGNRIGIGVISGVLLALMGCGKDGANGSNGLPGTPGKPGDDVHTVQFCPGVVGHYGVFPEVGCSGMGTTHGKG